MAERIIAEIKVKNGAKGDTGATGVGYRVRGEWNNTDTYVNNNQYIDTVSINGSTFYCKTNSMGQNPLSSPTHWGILAQKGDNGVGAGNTNVYFDKESSEIVQENVHFTSDPQKQIDEIETIANEARGKANTSIQTQAEKQTIMGDLTIEGDEYTESRTVNIGGAKNAKIKVRHIEGKSHLSEEYDNLFLNHVSKLPVVVGGDIYAAKFFGDGSDLTMPVGSCGIDDSGEMRWMMVASGINKQYANTNIMFAVSGQYMDVFQGILTFRLRHNPSAIERCDLTWTNVDFPEHLNPDNFVVVTNFKENRDVEWELYCKPRYQWDNYIFNVIYNTARTKYEQKEVTFHNKYNYSESIDNLPPGKCYYSKKRWTELKDGTWSNVGSGSGINSGGYVSVQICDKDGNEKGLGNYIMAELSSGAKAGSHVYVTFYMPTDETLLYYLQNDYRNLIKCQVHTNNIGEKFLRFFAGQRIGIASSSWSNTGELTVGRVLRGGF